MASKITQKAGNLLSSLLSSTLNYLRRGTGTGIEAGLSLGGATEQQKQQARIDLPKFLQFRTEAERKELEDKPLLSLGKTLAGNLAMATPLGKGVGGAIKTGATAGALGGFGASKQGQELGSTLGGAAIGGAMGGALGVLGKVKNLFKSSQQAGQNIRTGVRAPKVSASPFAVEEQQAISNTLSELGAKGSASNQIKQLPIIFRKLDTQVDDALKASTVKVPKINVKEVVSNSIDDLVNFNPQDKAFATAKNKFLNIIDKTGADELSEKAIVELKRSLNKNNQMSRIFSRLEKGTTPLTASEEVALATWQSLDDLLSGAVKDLTRKQSTLYQAAPGLIKQSTKGGLNIPIIGKTGGQTVQAGKDLLGRVLESAGKAGSQIPSVQTPAIARNVMLQGILNAGGQPQAVQPTVEQAPVVPNTQIDRTTLPPEKQKALDIIDQAEAQSKGGVMGGIGEITPQQAMMAQVLLSPKELTKFNAMYKIQQDTNKTTTKAKSATALQVEGKAKSGLEATKLIQTMLEKNPNLTTRADVPMLNLLKGQDRKLYESAVSSLTDAIGGLRTGASVSKEQQAFYKNMLPAAGDDLATIKSKLNAVNAELQGYLGMNIVDSTSTENNDINTLMQMLGQ